VVGLSARAPLEALDQDDGLRKLVASEVMLGEGDEVLARRPVARAGLDHGGHLLAEALVGRANHYRVVYGGMAAEHLLHFLRVDLFASGVDRYRAAAEDDD